MDTHINAFLEYVSKVDNPEIVLIRKKEVVQWLYGDLSFLPDVSAIKTKKKQKAQNKVNEDLWGRAIMKSVRPDLTLDKQWTNLFGQIICKELYTMAGKKVTKNKKKKNYDPDWECESDMLEAKAGTFNTGGTAGEKILGCPFKYAEIPELFGKPLKILCMGHAEKECREKFGNLTGDKCVPQKKKFLDFFRENGIEYVGATELMRSLIPN